MVLINLRVVGIDWREKSLSGKILGSFNLIELYSTMLLTRWSNLFIFLIMRM